MVDRIAKPVEDDEIVIDTVRTSPLSKSRLESDDAFAKNAEEVKGWDGLDSNFKRRVTNSINKVRRGQDGTESKQIQEKELITAYNIFDVVEPSYNLDYLAKLYEMSSPHYAAVNAKVSNIVGLGYKFVENNKSKRNLENLANNPDKTKSVRRKLNVHRDELQATIESMNEDDSFVETLIKVWRDYEVTGNGYIEVGRRRDGTIGFIGHVPSQTIRIRKKRDGFVQMSGFRVQFFANFGAGIDSDKNPVTIPNPIGNDQPNEIIHLKKYSPTSGYYGVPDIVSATQAIAGNEFAARYNLDYFENKAVPRYAIILKGAKLGVKAEQDLLSFFETTRGQNHRSIYIPLPADTADNKISLEMKAIEAGIQDASFTKYRAANLADILMAHRVPVTKVSVSEGAALAVARDADKTFKEQVCGPEQKSLEKKLNRIVSELTDAFDLKLVEMTLTDENTQSQIEERRRKTGVETANEQRIRRGDPAVEGGDELFDMNGSSKAAQQRAESSTNRERDAARSANATDSVGEGRNPKGDGRTTP